MPQPHARPAGVAEAAWRLAVGRPLRRSETAREEITPVEGLSALSLDALTSVAYGPEAILVALAVAGAGALHLVLPITLVIVGLLVVLVVSYRQVIDAYPEGGGAYAVARANLGRYPSLVAAGALIVDYTLTVAVSIAAGVGALTSAFSSLSGATVPLCLGILAVVTLLNLRGLGEAARAFLLPTLVFIVGILAVIVIGLVHPLARHTPPLGHPLVSTGTVEAVGVLLILKAFSAGCSALTGIEAIANGVPLFRKPRPLRAKRAELLLGAILAVMLVGLAYLASSWHLAPRSGETVLSQVIAVALGRHWAYYVVSLSVTAALALAANTSFGGLPVLGSLLARDHYLPHLYSLRDDRQTFATGIGSLAVLAAALLLAVGGSTIRLIPLYAIGVFTGFTLAQSGLVVHWYKTRPRGWRPRAAVNVLGAAATAVATAIFLFSKFTSGAWVVVIAVPCFVLLFTRVAAYYDRLGTVLGIHRRLAKPQTRHTVVVVPIVSVSRLAERAIGEALSLGDEVLAVTVVASPEEAVAFRRRWEAWDPGVELRVLETEYASVTDPIVSVIDELAARPASQLVVLIPVVLPDRLRYAILHNHLDAVLGRALRHRDDLIVARVRFPLAVLTPRRRRGAPR